MNRLLLVEDDQHLGQSLKGRLEREYYRVDWAQTKAEAERMCASGNEANLYDLIILDVGLPDGSGLDLARDLRLSGNACPIIFLSAQSSAEYRLEGFELGAEDYIPKPFHLKELLLRIHKVLASHGREARWRFGSVTIDSDRRAIVFDDGHIEYPAARDFQLLCFLVEQSPRVVNREEILKQVWNNDQSQSSRSVDNSIMRLRQTFKRSAQDPIRSVRGVGYQWVG